jgi:VIT1/CCC1 family predicted Fe2+/Mn2+ transporter
MELAGRYVSGFERKWNARGGAAEESLLGSADIQSLADMSTAVGIVNEMRIAPISMRLLIAFAMAALLPLLPLLLLKYPVTTLVEQVFTRLLSLPQ